MPGKKRKSEGGGSSTGGTGDVKPQTMVIVTNNAAGNDDYSVTTVTLPIVRPRERGDKAVIMEILDVSYYVGITNMNNDISVFGGAYLAPTPLRAAADTASLVNFTTDLQNPNACCPVAANIVSATSGAVINKYPWVFDATDKNGNGLLWASDRMTFHVAMVGDAAQGAHVAILKYRWYAADEVEYYGILQSQTRAS